MHTEHLQNVTFGRVIAAWLVAIAVASLVALALIGTGVLTDEATAANTWWSTLAVAIGFFAGGFFGGFRAIEAPILHAAGIGLTSLAVWFSVNALVSLFYEALGWELLTPQLAVGLLFVQLAAAIVGSLLGYNVALRGKPGLSEHEPVES